MNDKIIAIKIKDENQYTEIPIAAFAQNIYWDDNLDFNLKQHIIGNIKSKYEQDANDNTVLVPIPLQEQIDDLSNDKADIDSPTFTGEPKSVTPGANDNSTKIATTAFVKNQIQNQLTTDALGEQSALSVNNPTNITNRQYPVVFDSNEKLSVNVPWENTVFSSSIENIWTGICSTSSGESEKEIILDHLSTFPTEIEESELDGNEILAIYFENGNTANNLEININNTTYSVGFLNKNKTISTNNNPFYSFGPGLKFFVYKRDYDGFNHDCWLLSTIDSSTILQLNDTKANINSPVFTGTPAISTNSGSSPIATQAYVAGKIPENMLKATDLVNGTVTAGLESEAISSMNDRQYAVVFDSQNHLSVNVPWTSPASAQNIKKVWTGYCDNNIEIRGKNIHLNNESGNYGGLISNQGANSYIIDGANILIYFKYGNNIDSPTITINGTNLEKDILYQSGPNTYSKIDVTSYYQWGPGLKIFTYVKYTENNEQKDGWVISSFDGLVIKNLNDRLSNVEENKANINSPIFGGVPESTLPNGSNLNQIATVGYVKSILGSDSNYAIQLKPNGGNNNIFTVDWNGNVNGIDLNCFHTEGIMKSRPEANIIGQYNEITGLVCRDDFTSPICSTTLLVGEQNNIAFVIGNGADNQNRSNLFVINKDNGAIRIKNNEITIGTPPLEDYYRNILYTRDSQGYNFASILSTYYSEDDASGITIQSSRDVDGTNIYNVLRLLIDKDGKTSVKLTNPYAWHSALYVDAMYSSPNNPRFSTINIDQMPCAGYLSNSSKQLVFFIPHNVTSGTATLVKLALCIRGGSGQEYLYEASGSNNTTYTQLGTSPVVVWENSRTKRTNGIENVAIWVRRASGFKVAVNFKNTLRKSNSTTVAQNNTPYAVSVIATIQLS